MDIRARAFYTPAAHASTVGSHTIRSQAVHLLCMYLLWLSLFICTYYVTLDCLFSLQVKNKQNGGFPS
jgi:hypothetical protein